MGMNIMDRISGEFGEESNNVLSTMRDIDITDRNMDDWWKQYDTEIKAFKDSLGGKIIKTESPDADELVCKTHKDMMKTLNAVKTQWGKVWSAWEAKNQLLELIWGILNADDKENKNESGLHCKKDGQSGAAKQLCNLLTELRNKSVVEKEKLNSEQATIDEYINNVKEYKCDCTFADWDAEFGECGTAEKGSVKEVNIYKECDKAETMKELEGNSKCKPTKSACGEGKHSRTRTRRWDAKDGGEGETGKICKVGKQPDGTVYSAVDKNEKQTLTADCKAGDYDGKCPVDCQWSAWDGDIDTAACPAKTCADKGTKQQVTREKIKERQYGGKFCFRDEKGHYRIHQKPCSFEITAALAQNKLAHEKDKYESLVGVLKKEMCKDLKGPCGDNGKCNVEINDDGKLTSWCKCNEGYKGNWCEQAPPKEEKKTEWVKQEEGKIFSAAQVGCSKPPGLGSVKVTTVEQGMAKCEATYGANAVTYYRGYCDCYKCTSSTATIKGITGAVSYFKPT